MARAAPRRIPPRRPSRTAQLARTVLIALALISQLALGAIVVPDQAQARQATALDALGIVCGQPAPARQHDAPRRRHAADLALCPAAAPLAPSAAILSPTPLLPAPGALAAPLTWAAQPPRAPPARPQLSGFARGPPVLA